MELFVNTPPIFSMQSFEISD